VLGINGAMDFFTMAKYRVLLTADQRTYVLSIISLIQIIINTIVIVLLANFRLNIVLVRFAASFSIFLRSYLLYQYCRKKYPYINYNEIPNNEALNKRWDAFYLQMLGVAQNGLPVILLTLLLGDLKIISIYAVFNLVISGINNILGIFTAASSASFGEIIVKNEKITLKKTYKEFEFSYYLIITIIYTVTFITIQPFINIYTKGITDANYNMPVVGFLFVLNGLLYNIKTPQGMLVISAGLYKETRWRSTVQALIILIFGILLTPSLGILGVLLASILSNLYRDIDLMVFIPRKVTKTKIKDTAIRILRIFICVAVSYIPFGAWRYTPEIFSEWIKYTIIVLLYTSLNTFIINFLFDKKEMKNVYQRLKGVLFTK